jgi:hypothetical protein
MHWFGSNFAHDNRKIWQDLLGKKINWKCPSDFPEEGEEGQMDR